MKFEVYTEDKNLLQVESLISNQFPGFTILKTLGYWRFKKEKGLLIIIFHNQIEDIKRLSKSIKKLNNQESILIWDGKQEFYL